VLEAACILHQLLKVIRIPLVCTAR